ncbi:MAG: hypothetical protein AAGI25_14390 [Bacteroidota bacterium]
MRRLRFWSAFRLSGSAALGIALLAVTALVFCGIFKGELRVS